MKTRNLMLVLGLILFWTCSKTEDPQVTNESFSKAALEATVIVETRLTDDDIEVSKKGTGAIIGQDGRIITNYHNIGTAQEIQVILYDGSRLKGEILKALPEQDLVLLKIRAENLTTFPIKTSYDLEIGTTVYAIGNPFNLDFSMTSGIVSSLDRKFRTVPHLKNVKRFIQTDVPINSGCSGGPLFDNLGYLVGINTAIVTNSGNFEGYSLAIPSDLIQDFLASL